MAKGIGIRILPTSAAIAAGFGAAAGVLHLYMRLAHNAQGEMYDAAGSLDISYSLLLFLPRLFRFSQLLSW